MRTVDAGSAESLLGFAEGAGPGLRGLDANALFDELEARDADLLAALQWFLDTGRTDDALRLAIALAPVWMARKRLDEGLAWFDKALAAPGGSDITRGNAYFQAGLLAFWPGHDERSSELHGKALWTPLAMATGAPGNSTALVGSPETVAEALLEYVDVGVSTILIRGYDPLDDAIDYGRDLLPILRQEMAHRERAAEKVAA